MAENRESVHKINLTARNNIIISGVVKVLSSNETSITLNLFDTNLSLFGTKFSIESFNDGVVQISGTLDSLKYSKQTRQKESFFKRIFK